MKLDKSVVQRRIDLMAAEGVTFVPNTFVGKDVDPNDIRSEHDAVICATGATWPRDLKIPNREVDGIHFAMEFLQMNTKSLLDSELQNGSYISAKGKDVIVIGGGDTGNDCIGTAMRHGAKSVTNFELLPRPPAGRGRDNPWPQWPRIFRTDYGHTEVAAHFGNDPREYCISTKEFVVDDNGKLLGLNTVRVEWTKDSGGRWKMEETPGSEKFFPAQLVFLALGFLGPEADLLKSLGVKQDARSNIQTPKNVRILANHVHMNGFAHIFRAIRNTRRLSMACSRRVTADVGSRSSSGVSRRVAVALPRSMHGSATALPVYRSTAASRRG